MSRRPPHRHGGSAARPNGGRPNGNANGYPNVPANGHAPTAHPSLPGERRASQPVSEIAAAPVLMESVVVEHVEIGPDAAVHSVQAATRTVVEARPMEMAEDQAANAEARGCTAAQLRRFIKSRPYVPMHELRRRFELNGLADEVSPVQTSQGVIYVGLPYRESGFIADLVNQGDIGLELCRDPRVSIVMGVYAMRPITR